MHYWQPNDGDRVVVTTDGLLDPTPASVARGVIRNDADSPGWFIEFDQPFTFKRCALFRWTERASYRILPERPPC